MKRSFSNSNQQHVDFKRKRFKLISRPSKTIFPENDKCNHDQSILLAQLGNVEELVGIVLDYLIFAKDFDGILYLASNNYFESRLGLTKANLDDIKQFLSKQDVMFDFAIMSLFYGNIKLIFGDKMLNSMLSVTQLSEHHGYQANQMESNSFLFEASNNDDKKSNQEFTSMKTQLPEIYDIETVVKRFSIESQLSDSIIVNKNNEKENDNVTTVALNQEDNNENMFKYYISDLSITLNQGYNVDISKLFNKNQREYLLKNGVLTNNIRKVTVRIPKTDIDKDEFKYHIILYCQDCIKNHFIDNNCGNNEYTRMYESENNRLPTHSFSFIKDNNSANCCRLVHVPINLNNLSCNNPFVTQCEYNKNNFNSILYFLETKNLSPFELMECISIFDIETRIINSHLSNDQINMLRQYYARKRKILLLHINHGSNTLKNLQWITPHLDATWDIQICDISGVINSSNENDKNNSLLFGSDWIIKTTFNHGCRMTLHENLIQQIRCNPYNIDLINNEINPKWKAANIITENIDWKTCTMSVTSSFDSGVNQRLFFDGYLVLDINEHQFYFNTKLNIIGCSINVSNCDGQIPIKLSDIISTDFEIVNIGHNIPFYKRKLEAIFHINDNRPENKVIVIDQLWPKLRQLSMDHHCAKWDDVVNDKFSIQYSDITDNLEIIQLPYHMLSCYETLFPFLFDDNNYMLPRKKLNIITPEVLFDDINIDNFEEEIDEAELQHIINHSFDTASFTGTEIFIYVRDESNPYKPKEKESDHDVESQCDDDDDDDDDDI